MITKSKQAIDRIFRNASIYDGSGNPPFTADIALAGDEILEVGPIEGAPDCEIIDLAGLAVAPGFIDIHTHSDGSILDYPTADSRVMQGVTTEVTGNCGYSAAPRPEGDGRGTETSLLGQPIRTQWGSIATYFERLEAARISLNHLMLYGQGTLRRNCVGNQDRPPTADELRTMRRALEQGLAEGACGMSTGLEYTPGSFTPTEEIVDLARVVARYGGLYATHIRNEQEGLLNAIAEAIEIGKQANVRVQISHLKANGKPNWHLQDEALALIERARMEGVDVLADAYPYPAYSTSLSALLTPAMREGGADALVERLTDPATQRENIAYLRERVLRSPGGFELVVISRVETDQNREVIGLNLAQLGERWGVEPAEAMVRLLIEERGSVSQIGHGMNPENVATVLAHPLVMIASDGSSMAPVGEAAESKPHPRSYGTFARALSYYVRDRGALSLSEAVYKMTAMAADQLRLGDRGRIAPGKKADLVVFDARGVDDTATFEAPHQYPAGIQHVLVNGAFVVRDGHHTGSRPGQVLRGGAA